MAAAEAGGAPLVLHMITPVNESGRVGSGRRYIRHQPHPHCVIVAAAAEADSQLDRCTARYKPLCMVP